MRLQAEVSGITAGVDALKAEQAKIRAEVVRVTVGVDWGFSLFVVIVLMACPGCKHKGDQEPICHRHKDEQAVGSLRERNLRCETGLDGPNPIVRGTASG
jgi:hypothetical protein